MKCSGELELTFVRVKLDCVDTFTSTTGNSNNELVFLEVEGIGVKVGSGAPGADCITLCYSIVLNLQQKNNMMGERIGHEQES